MYPQAALTPPVPASPSFIAAGESYGSGLAGPLILPGTFVTIDCPDGWLNFTAGASIHCHDTVTSDDLCDTSTCTFTIAAKMDRTYTFAGWGTSGQAGVQSATTTPTTFYVYTPNPGNHYTGSLTLCHTGQSGCVNGGGGGCTAATMGTPIASVLFNYQQAWVNWTMAGTAPVTPGFLWWVTSGDYLTEPVISTIGSTASINLNDLAVGTTYHFEAEVSNGCGSDSLDGYFTTLTAPTNGYQGWVYPADPLGSNAHQLNQVGNPIPGASVWLSAYCEYEYQDTFALGTYYPSVALAQVAFPSVTTSSLGGYSLTFPLYDPYTIYVNVDGFEIPDDVLLTLGSNGVCSTSDSLTPEIWSGQPTTASNNHYLLEADSSGDWNATVWTTSTLSGTNDFQQFALPPDGSEIGPSGVAFVHTAQADCSITIENGFAETVDSSLAGSGDNYQNGWGTLEGNDQGYGSDSSVAFHYTTSGIANETSSPGIQNSYAVSGPYGPVWGQAFVDPYSSAPYKDAAHTLTVRPGGSIDQFGYLNGGYYTSTAGLDITVGLSLGWGGFSVSPSVDLVDTTSVTASSSNEILCSFKDPSQSQSIQFYFYAEGSEVANQEAVNLHIWYDDMCTPPAC